MVTRKEICRLEAL